MITFDDKGRGVRKPPKHGYIIYEWSLRALSSYQKDIGSSLLNHGFYIFSGFFHISSVLKRLPQHFREETQ